MNEKSLKKNAVLNIIKVVSTLIFPLITFPYISRVLLTENVGKYNFANTFVGYFSLIASLGIATYAIRACSAARSDKDLLSNTASQLFSINLLTTLISYVLLFGSILLFKNLKDYRKLIVIQSTVILFTTLGADWLNTAMEDFTYITFRTIAFQLVSLILLFIFVKKPEDYLIYAVISVVSSSGANILNILYRRKYCKIRITFHINWKKHMPPICFLFVMSVSQIILNSADITMLGVMHGDYYVGIYSTAYKIENIISQIISSFVIVLLPRLSYYFAEKDMENVNKLLTKVFGVIMLIGIPCYFGASVTAKEIILIIAGPEYADAIMPFRILLLSFLFSLVGGSFLGNIVLLSSGKEKKFMAVCCVAMVVNVIANAIFIPHFGVNAAAATTVFASFLIFFILLVSKDKNIKISGKIKAVISPVIGSVLFCLYCILIKYFVSNLYLCFAICVVGSVIIYSITLLVCKNEYVFEVIGIVKSKFKRNNKQEQLHEDADASEKTENDLKNDRDNKDEQ